MKVELLKNEIFYESNRVTVLADTIRYPNGDISQYTYSKGRDGVVVLGLLDDRKIVMIRQYRYLVGRVCLELPAGGIEATETPLQAAQREFIEETGFSALQWDKKLEFYPSNGICKDKVHVFFAKQLKYIGKPPATEEQTSVEEIDILSLKKLILSGEIPGASSLIALKLFLLEKDYHD